MKAQSWLVCLFAAIFVTHVARGQTQNPAPTPTSAPATAAAPVEMNAAEKQFQESMTNVTMSGFFTVGDDPATHEDKYTIGHITKIAEDLWNWEASIKYNNREFKATVKVPVKWAGDTPVITLSNYLIQGQGVYSARILLFQGQYAG